MRSGGGCTGRRGMSTPSFSPVPAADLCEMLRYRAALHPERIAFRVLRNGEEEIQRLTYGALYVRACAIAAMLSESPVYGAPVVLLFQSACKFLSAFFGCLEAGAIPVPAPTPLGGRRRLEMTAAIARDSNASLVLTEGSLELRIRPNLAHAPDLSGLEWLSVDQCESRLASAHIPQPTAPDAIAFLQYTSGSTGDPKGVAILHRNVLENQRLMQAAFGHTEETVFAGWLPHYHDMGLIGLLLHPLYLGASCIVLPPEAFLQDPSRWLRAISNYRAETSVAPSFAYDLCADRVGQLDPRTDLSTWRVAIVGAEPVRRRTLDRFARKFEPWGFRRSSFYPCYGLAEASLFVTGAPLDDDGGPESGTVFCGPARGFQEIEIVDRDRNPCAEGILGEIWVRGLSVASGYWNRSVETAARFEATLANGDGPFLRTQDLGTLRDGRLLVAGRLRNMIILNGGNFFAEDIESALIDVVDSDCRAVAFGIPDEDGEHLVILLEVRPERISNLDSEQVFAQVQQALGEHVGVRADAIAILRRGALPRTTSGKIRYGACKAMFAQGVPGAIALRHYRRFATFALAASGTSREEIETWLVHRVAQRLQFRSQDIDRCASFASLALTSLDVIEITEELARTLNLPLEPTLFWEFPSISEAAAAVESLFVRDRDPGSRAASDTALSDEPVSGAGSR